MDASVISAIAGGVGVAVTSVVSLVVARVNSKKDVTISDRQQLSQDQQLFYDLVMKQVKEYGERADLLEAEVVKWKEEALQLRIENSELRAQINHLEGIIGGGSGEES